MYATASLNAVTSISSTTVVLNGIVNANNTQTVITFNYGATAGYGYSVTANPSVITGNSDTAVMANISGLSQNTLYHYRITAVNADGTVNSTDGAFTTEEIIATATISDATLVTSKSAILHGKVNPNNSLTTVVFNYGTNTDYVSNSLATQSPINGTHEIEVSTHITGLTPNTLYHYRIMATNNAGIIYSSDGTFTSGEVSATVVLTEPTLVAATTIRLNGIVNANNLSTIATFEYGKDTDYGYSINSFPSVITGNASTAIFADINGLLADTLYHYRATAVNSSGNAYTEDATFTTSVNISIPSATILAVTAISSTSAILNGMIKANNSETSVTFNYGTTTNYGNNITATPNSINGDENVNVSAIVSGLLANTLYHYKITATNASGTVSSSDGTFLTNAVLPTVSLSEASGISQTSVMLNGFVNANKSLTTVVFNYGTTSSYGKNINAIQTPVKGDTRTFVSTYIPNLSANTLYHYRITATNAAGSVQCVEKTFITRSPLAQAIPVIIKDNTTLIMPTSVKLNAKVNPKNSTTNVLFKYGTTTNYSAVIPATQENLLGDELLAVSATLDSLMPNTTYYYCVTATNEKGTVSTDYGTFATPNISFSVKPISLFKLEKRTIAIENGTRAQTVTSLHTNVILSNNLNIKSTGDIQANVVKSIKLKPTTFVTINNYRVPTVNNTASPKDGDIKITNEVVSMYAEDAWRQIYPPIYD